MAPQRDPRKLSEFTLWRMRKDGRAIEARTRILPHGDGLLDLIIYVSRSAGTWELHWSQTLSGREVTSWRSAPCGITQNADGPSTFFERPPPLD
jgi:hypothetical protein